MRIAILLSLWHIGLATAVPQALAVEQYPNGPLALEMLDSIILRQQGVTVNASVKTSVIEAGLLLMGIDEVLENIPLSDGQNAKYSIYLERVMSGLIPALMNMTTDVTSPLDEFSVGTQFIKQ